MNSRGILPLLAVLALGVLAGVPARADVVAECEAKAQTAKVRLENAQWAILHALLDWQGGTNPPFGFYKDKDGPVLRKLGISVQPVIDPTTRAILTDSLVNIRRQYNTGRINHYNRGDHITLQQMRQRHKELIRKFAANISFGASGVASASGRATQSPEAAYREQDERVTELIKTLNDMATADQHKDDAAFAAAVAQFNLVAAGFHNGYELKRGRGESRQDVRNRGLKIYGDEQKRAVALADQLRGAELTGAQERAKGQSNAPFGEGSGSGQVGAGGAGSFAKSDPNNLANANLKADVKVDPPAPDLKPGDKQKPGLFGMLGAFLGALFRTIGRVATALFKGLVGVGKALFS